MSINPLPDEAVDAVVLQVLEVMGVTLAEWEGIRATLLRSTPVWPGSDVQFSSATELAPYIDHTLLKADAVSADVAQLCDEAVQHGFASVCVNSSHVNDCVARLKDTDVTVCGVVGFPLGAMATEVKKCETELVVDNGAGEVDMVINIGGLKAADARLVTDDIRAVVDAAWGCPVKVILETGLLDGEDIIAGCVLASLAGAAFVKTSTGFGHGGATIEAVRLMRHVTGASIGVKASGGIRDTETAVRMIMAGANRIGTSNGVSIVSQSGQPGQPEY